MRFSFIYILARITTHFQKGYERQALMSAVDAGEICSKEKGALQALCSRGGTLILCQIF
jgi:hypothetical protein